MTQEELVKENEKLTARLQKAVTVFGEQKATIERLTAERDEAVAKTKGAKEQDDLFFEQQKEIEGLKEELSITKAHLEETETQLTAVTEGSTTEINELKEEIRVANEKLAKTKEYLSKIANSL